ncbi:MAG: aminodeoxychorismate lyase [Ectobacillus sp.]
MLIYVNGKFMEDKEAVISPYDHGYLYGLGAFETFRVYEGHPFLFNDHYERLMTALSYLHIKWDMTRDDILYILQELLERNSLKNAYIRLNVSAGIGEVGLQTDPYLHPSIIMFVKPLPAPGDIVEKEGVILRQPRNTPEGIFRLKSHHYLNNILGKREIGDNPAKEGIFLTKEGYVAEGIVSNLFFIKNNILHTPSVDTGILNGITRKFVLEMAKCLDIQVKEGFFAVEELLASAEVFATNSIQEIVPICSIRDSVFAGKKGPVTSKLLHMYRTCRPILWSRRELREGERKSGYKI